MRRLRGAGRPAAGRRVLTDERSTVVDAAPEDLWQVIAGIGGEHGWYSLPYAWSVRGALDRLVGGIGLRPGRPDPHRVQVGDPVDFWRVEQVRDGRLLRLRAEMRLPGPTWLELRVETDSGRTVYRQRVVFHPDGLVGRLYWWSVVPLHGPVFGTSVRRIARAAAARQQHPQDPEQGEREHRTPA